MKKNYGFGLIYVLAGIVVVVVAVTGVFIYRHNHKTTNNSSTGNISNNTRSQVSDLYAGWKTAGLTNEKFGFRYPADWTEMTSSNTDINNTGTKSTENIEVKSPIDNGHYFGVSLMAGPANKQINLNMLGNSPGTTLANLNVKGSRGPLYLVAQTTEAEPNNVTCLGLASSPGSQSTSFGILDNNGKGQHSIVMYACITPVTATLTDNGSGYSMGTYTSNKYYQTVLKIFQSLRYN